MNPNRPFITGRIDLDADPFLAGNDAYLERIFKSIEGGKNPEHLAKYAAKRNSEMDTRGFGGNARLAGEDYKLANDEIAAELNKDVAAAKKRRPKR